MIKKKKRFATPKNAGAQNRRTGFWLNLVKLVKIEKCRLKMNHSAARSQRMASLKIEKNRKI